MNDLVHVERVESHGRCAVRIAGEGGVNRERKIIRSGMFEDESGRPGAERCSRHPLIAAGGDQDDLRLRRGMLDVAARIDSIHLWHREVGDDDVRGERARSFEQRTSVSHSADDFVRWLQQALPRRKETGVVICQEDARPRV